MILCGELYATAALVGALTYALFAHASFVVTWIYSGVVRRSFTGFINTRGG